MTLSMSAFIKGVSFVDFRLLFYNFINQLIAIAIVTLVLRQSSASCPHCGELRMGRTKMRPKAAKTTEDSKNRSRKNISTKNRSVSPMSVTTKDQSNVSLKRDLRGCRGLCYNRRYQKYQRVNQRTCPFASHLVGSNCNSPEPSIFGDSSRRQLGPSNSGLKPAADGNKEYDTNSSKPRTTRVI